MKTISSTHLNIALALAICGVLFQNCAAAPPPDMGSLSSSSYIPNTGAVPANLTCNFGGQVLTQGQQVIAYATNTLPAGGNCGSIAEIRTCSNGVLSGSYNYLSCSAQSAAGTASCTLGGQTIAHNGTITAYSSSTAPYDSTCAAQSQVRTCTNGTLSGSYTATSCTRECSFAGASVPSGQQVTAYAASSVPYGSTCSSQQRTCTNGNLDGSYQYASCSPEAAPSGGGGGGGAASCSLDGVTVAHNDSRIFYNTDVAYQYTCNYYAQSRTCTNGVLSGSSMYAYSSCYREYYYDGCRNTNTYYKMTSEAISDCQYY
jgi:hypothetical protein